MKLTATPNNRYLLQLEPGDTVDILFNPDGEKATSDGNENVCVLTVGTVVLPKKLDLALIFYFADMLYKSISLAWGHSNLYACRDYGADKLEFTLQEESPRRHLAIEKIDLNKLLKGTDDI